MNDSKCEPRRIRRFSAQTFIGALLVVGWFGWRHFIPPPIAVGAIACLGAALAVSLVQPRWFAGFARAGLAFSRRSSERLSQLLLVAFYFFALVPLALFLRLTRYDPLALRRPTSSSTYWRRSAGHSDLRRMF